MGRLFGTDGVRGLANGDLTPELALSVAVAAARVLVASDNAHDAAQIVEQIGGQHRHVRSSVDPARAVGDFEAFQPDVLLLAFDVLDKAQRYSLGLYRHSQMVSAHRHATVLLCSKDEVRAAFELCKSGHYDDYVLHWPHAQDGQRLAMSVWNAARTVAALSARPSAHELNVHATQLVDVDSLLREEMAEGEQRLGAAARALHDVEHAVGAAIDEFSDRMTGPGPHHVVATKDKAALGRELAHLKDAGIASAFRAGAADMAPAVAWPRQLHDRLEPHLAAMTGFEAALRPTASTVLVVDDDAFARKLILKALDGEAYALEFAASGVAALQLLRRVRPRLILMDIGLPDVDGVALTRKLKATQHLADIPVLMLTGNARRETLAESISAGAAGFIVKPFTREAVLQQIARVLPTA